ncbi:MAG: cyclic nucleotide-binding domain-containing protein [Thiohalomonadales bacterium]
MKHKYDLATMFADCFLFQHFKLEDYDAVKSLLQWQHVPAGEYIFHEDDIYSGFYLLCDGQVEIVKRSLVDKTTERTLSVLGKGEIFGELALFLPNGRRSASAKTTLETDCCFLPCETFDKLLEENAPVANKIVLAVAKSLSERLDEVTKNALLLSECNVDNNNNTQDILKFKQQLATLWSF